jgi:hypothetical protein
MLRRAAARGVPGAGQGCVSGECEECRQVPVQLWRHTKSGETRHAWLLERPEWQRQEYTVVHRFTCFYACRRLHLHHCAVGSCDSVERGHVVKTDAGEVCCGVSGRVLSHEASFDWKERKKGAYTARSARRAGPVVVLGHAEGAGQQHNAYDWKLMQTSVNVIFDCLFSKLRRELYANERRAQKKSLESRVLQYAKACKRQHKIAYVAHFNRLAIENNFFSSRTYDAVVRVQNPRTVLRRLGPFLVALYKTLNATTPLPTQKNFPAFGIAVLYLLVRGVTLHGVRVIPCIPHMGPLLPHPNAVEGFFRFLWAFYAETATTQRSFLTKTCNAIKATLRGLADAAAAVRFERQTQQLAEALRAKYYDIVERELDRL